MIELIVIFLMMGALQLLLKLMKGKRIQVLNQHQSESLQVTVDDYLPPPNVCAKVAEAMQSNIRKSYGILSKYYGIALPSVVFDEEYLKHLGYEAMQSGRTIYLRNNADLKTCFHEFWHYLARCERWKYSKSEESSADYYAYKMISKARKGGFR